MADLIGQRIGNYEITSILGKGGMAVVYRAHQLNIQRDVAIKVIKPDLSETDDLIKRFEREANMVASLNHSHILKLFDFGQYEGMLYLVMELMTGGTLADAIRETPLSPERTARLLDQIADALDYAHKQGLIHRDLKPQNILLDKQGNAHLTDFGIAKRLGDTTSITQRGVAMGTPAYMPPEQWQGLQLTRQADLYSLGVMLYEMLTGRLPFTANTPASMMYRHLQELPLPIHSVRDDLPAALDGFFERTLAKTPEQRFGSAGELREALKAAMRGQAMPTQAKAQTARQQYPQQAITEQPTVLGDALPEQAPTTGIRRSQRTIALGVLGLILLLGVFAAIRTFNVPLGVAVVATNTSVPTNAATKVATAVANATDLPLKVPPTLTPTATPTPFDPIAAAKATNTAEAITSAPRTATYNAGQTATAALWTVTKSAPTLSPPTSTPPPSLPTQVATATGVPTKALPTLTPSATHTPTFDPIVAAKATNIAEAINFVTQTAAYNGGLTATAALWTATLPPPTSIPVPLLQGIVSSVTNNSQWTPQFTDVDGVTMALVPPGCFLMGSATFADAPPNKQCFDKPFLIDKYLVTNGQFAQFKGKAAQRGAWLGNKWPRETIKWFEARDFCAVRGARLPTEAEWEYVARGPDDLAYPWGNDFVALNGVYPETSGGQTAEVGSKPKGVSWVGALDMAGNVWEWTNSAYEAYPYSATDGRENNSGGANGRVLRGGSYSVNFNDRQSAGRYHTDSFNTAFSYIGFRCARS